MNTDIDINKRAELLKDVPTPCFVTDELLLKRNLEILKGVSDRTGAEILLAQKAFSMFSLYPLIGKYLAGTTASGLFEAKLGYEYMKKENHIFSPAYKTEEFDEIVRICDHIVFNSFNQWEKFKGSLSGKSAGIRINPEYSTQKHGIYDPCAEFSRLGVTRANFPDKLPAGIDGLHFHTLCEQNSDDLEETLYAVEEKFGRYFNDINYINFGGGHHITRADYNISKLESCINRIKDKYGLQVYLEPGEAVV
ncbi:MAG: carboxynorspermidine decarboxylase, partial [Oscillospiraceae bacterium]|nr:carboxynorspermidine decarboxylase [Oscillospiraceae bacterium]